MNVDNSVIVIFCGIMGGIKGEWFGNIFIIGVKIV